MPGPITRFLPAGLALSGALLATAAVPSLSSPGEHAAAPAPVVQPAPPVKSTVAPRRVVTSATPTAIRTTPGRTKAATTKAGPTTAAPARTARTTTATTTTARTTTSRTAALRTTGACSGAGWEQRRGEAALRSLRPAARSGYGLRFLGARSGFYGLTRPSLKMIEVYVRSCSRESDALLRHVIAHELGHAYDKTRMTAAQRTAYKAARGIPAGTPWFGCNRCADFATPAGDFAEVYAQWRRGATSNRSTIGDAPSPAELDALAKRFFGA